MDPILGIPKKKTKGRRKIPMERIDHKAKRYVTFSKRRTNLFKKAGELCTLCGSEIAIIAFSEAGKAFTFGHPNANSVIQRYLHGSSSVSSPDLPSSLRSDPTTPINYSVAQTANPNGSMKADGCGDQFWWEGCIDNMGLEELQQYTKSLELLKNNAVARATCIAANIAGLSNKNANGIKCEEGSVDHMGMHNMAASATTLLPPCSPLFAPNMVGLSNQDVYGIDCEEGYVDNMGKHNNMASSATTFMPPCSPLFAPNMAGLSDQNIDGITCEQDQDWLDLYAEMQTWFADEGNLVQL